MTGHAELLEWLTELRAAWVERGWSWDNRFECAASAFDLDEADRARELVLRALPNEYDSRNIGSAPPLYQRVADATGGVRSDQRMFGAGTEDLIAYGLWWPWGGEVSSRITLRVGLGGQVSTEQTLELRGIFGALE